MDDALTEELKRLAGPGGWLAGASDLEPYVVDWRGRKRGTADLLLRPATTEALAAIVRFAADHRIGLLPQGGNTSLCGGSVPEPEGGTVIVSMRRMNRIRALDPLDGSVIAEAGVILQSLHEAADATGCMFPLSLAAKGSATIGGLISTNAGGVQVLRWGTMRAQVLGLEAVLPDGTVLNQLSALRKDNTGYDIKQLLVGAEGTLGFVTAAALRLVPKPATMATAFAGLPGPDAALALLNRMQTATGGQIDSFELIPRLGIELVLTHIAGTRDPLADAHPWYVLAEATSSRRDDGLGALMEAALADAITAGEAVDATVATSDAQRAALWRLREELPEAERLDGPSVKHDVSVAVASMPRFIAAGTAEVERGWPGAGVLAFGHLGDGNVHFNVRPPAGVAYDDFVPAARAITSCINDLTVAHGGSISAEHGIGTLKRGELRRLGDPAKLVAMAAVKAALDPLGIMNPGKLL